RVAVDGDAAGGLDAERVHLGSSHAHRPEVALPVVVPGHVHASTGSGGELAVPAALLGGGRVGDRRRGGDRFGELHVGHDTDLPFAGRFAPIGQVDLAARVEDAVRIDDLTHPARAGQAQDAPANGGGAVQRLVVPDVARRLGVDAGRPAVAD